MKTAKRAGNKENIAKENSGTTDMEIFCYKVFNSTLGSQNPRTFHHSHQTSNSLNPNPRLNYLKYRKIYIEWIEEICKTLDIPWSVVHTTSKLFDKLILENNYNKTKYQALILTCLSLSYKFESDTEILSLSDLVVYCPSGTQKEFKILEIEVLNKINWNLWEKTVFSYLTIYTDLNFVLSDYDHLLPSQVEKNLKVKKYAFIMADLANKMNSFIFIHPKALAAACISLARKKAGLQKIWKPSLEKLIGLRPEACHIENLELEYNLDANKRSNL
jgi:Cyclin, N-terminal domain